MDNQELLKKTSKWLVLMGIDGEPTRYTKNYLQWHTHKENLLKQGTLENVIYHFYDGKPNYKKLTEEVAYLVELNKNFDKASIVSKLKDKKKRGITTIIRPTKEEIADSYDDFGFVNLNPEISTGEYQKLFDYYCKGIGKVFKSQKEKQSILEKMMIGTQQWDYALLENYIDEQIAKWKRNNKK